MYALNRSVHVLRVMTVAAVFLAFGSRADVARAQQPSPDNEKRTLAIEITQANLEAIDIDKLSAAALDQSWRNSGNKSSEARQVILSLAPLIREEIESMKSDLVNITSRFYEENFDVEELKQMRAFSVSPVGRKHAQLGGEFTARLTVTLQQTMAARRPAIEARVKAELEKRGYKH